MKGLHGAVDITKGADTFGFKTKNYVHYEESICIFFFAAQCKESKNAHFAVVYNTRTSQLGVVNLLEITQHQLQKVDVFLRRYHLPSRSI